MEFLRVSYRVDVPASEAQERAEALALEQTVEVPRVVVRDAFIESRILGRVEAVEPDPRGGQRITIAIPDAATALDPAQIMNLMFGNSSLHADVECVDVDFPASIAKALRGPRFGIAGLRALVGARNRPLTCTALKPMGQSPEAMAELFRTFARAGIDFVKDDQGLAEHVFCPFEARVRACLAAEREVAEETGRRSVYVPNLIGTPETIFRQLEFAQAGGARAVMVSPMLVGLPVFWEICQQRASVPVLAHPSFAGAQRIAPEILFGRIFRAYGADAVVFVSYGSRFSPPEDACRRLADNLVEPWDGILPALPVPGGGIRVDTAASVVKFYGVDSMLLVGGDLQIAAGETAERSRAFVEAVAGSG
jgi:ribulose-bisphosphate carboxylase large chain